MTIRKALFWLIILLTGITGRAQMKDAGLWANASLDIDLGKGLDGAIAPEVRLGENMSELTSFFSDFGIKKKLTDWADIGLEYRAGAKRDYTSFDFRNRLTFSLAIKEGWNHWAISLLSRSQVSPSVSGFEGDVELSTMVREKLGLKYTGLKKTDLATSLEFFIPSFSDGPTAWRWQAVAEHKLDKRHSVSAGYLIQKDLQNQDMDFVVLLGYQWELAKKKKKEKNS